MCQKLKSGDRIRAIEGTVSALFADGRDGTVAEVRDPKGYSGNNSNNLVRWDGSIILMGFHPDQVTLVTGDSDEPV